MNAILNKRRDVENEWNAKVRREKRNAKANELSLHKVNARIYSKYSLYIRFVIQKCVCVCVWSPSHFGWNGDDLSYTFVWNTRIDAGSTWRNGTISENCAKYLKYLYENYQPEYEKNVCMLCVCVSVYIWK